MADLLLAALAVVVVAVLIAMASPSSGGGYRPRSPGPRTPPAWRPPNG